MRFLKKEAPVLLLLLLLVFPTIKALALPGFYTSHDGETHTARLANFYLAIKEGQLPPQLAPTLFGGFGFPIFIFIYPLPYLVGSLFHALGFSYTDSAELVMASAQIISALVLYLFFKLESKNTLTSLIATLFFTWAPYRLLMLYVRGAFAESFAYIFIATTLVCLNRLVETKHPQWVGFTGLSLAGLLLSHQLVSAMFLPVIVFYLATKLVSRPQPQTYLKPLFLAFALGFGLAAYIYLPAFFERRYLRFDDLINYYQDHFVTLRQLIRSPWSYGFSHPGVANDDMSFQVGLTHLAAVAISFLLLLPAFLHRRFSRLDSLIAAWLCVFTLSILVMLEHPLVHWLWAHLPGLSIIDFPWRFLGVTVFSVSFIVFYLLQKTKNHPLLVVFLTLFVFYANRNHLRINQTVNFSDDYFEHYPATATWRNEFLPRTRNTNKWAGIEGDFHLEKGQAQIKLLDDRTHRLSLQLDASTPVEIIIHRLYFPGWQVRLNGQPLPFTSPEVSVTDAAVDLKSGIDYSGFIKLNLEKGRHRVDLFFLPARLRQVGLGLSLISLAACLYLIINPKLKLLPL